MTTLPQAFSFRGPQNGAHLLVLGAVHGDEVCGTLAIRKVMEQIQRGQLPLHAGRVTFIPVCNPRAYRQGVRFTEENLNRVFRHHPHPSSYEAGLANALVPFVEQADYALDLHSMQATGSPCVFQDDETPDCTSFARALGVPLILHDWPKVRAAGAPTDESDTITYARRKGRTGVLVECGQHRDPAAIDVAERAIRQALAHLKLTSALTPPPPGASPTHVSMNRVVFLRGEGHFTHPWRHLDPLKKGDTIGVYKDGRCEVATEDGYILLPRPVASIGQEWFYVGTVQNPHVPGPQTVILSQVT